MQYSKHFQSRSTPQNQPIPGETMVPNAAGGYAFPVDDWTRLRRFLILGSEGGTFYVGEQKLTIENANAVLRCVKADGGRVVGDVVGVSQGNLAPKNDPAIFVLAMCAKMGDAATRRKALAVLPLVARTGMHLFQFAECLQAFGGWGRGTRTAIANWYARRTADDLAYQVLKYQERNGWSHRDLLRLCHAKAPDAGHAAIYRKLVKDERDEGLPDLFAWVEAVKTMQTADAVAYEVEQHRLSREMIPTQWLTDPLVQKALLADMPLHALIRNLGNLSKSEVLSDAHPDIVSDVVAKLSDANALHRSRVHPMALLLAEAVYQSGKSVKGHGSWNAVGRIIDALDAGFYAAFDNVAPTGKRICIGIDASGSMQSAALGVAPISARAAAVALALVTASVEPNYCILAFTQGEHVLPVPITPRQRILDAVALMNATIIAEGTDCALPFRWATRNKAQYDAFLLITDNETWAGTEHPVQALQDYRRQMNPSAKLVVMAMTATNYSIADPNDRNVLNVVGFDASVPDILRSFLLE